MSGCIPEAQANLAAMLYRDPTFALAGAVAWLDPVTIPDVEYGEDQLIFALTVCNECFPDLYQEAMVAIWSGQKYYDVESLICGGIDEQLEYGGLEEFEQIAYGIPWECYGADVWGHSEDDVEETMPEILPVLRRMGYIDDPQRETMNTVERVSIILAEDLERYPDNDDAKCVRMLLQWLFNATGHGLADYTNEALSESDVHFYWTLEQIKFVNTLHKEALDAVQTAMEGRDLLLRNKVWGKAFTKNARKALQYSIKQSAQKNQMYKEGKKPRAQADRKPAFTWPGCDANGS